MADPRFFEYSGSKTIGEIAKHISAEIEGDASLMLQDVAALGEATSEHISFLDNPKYLPKLPSSKAGACIIHPKYKEKVPKGMVLLLHESPYYAYAKIANLFHPNVEKSVIHPSASIGAGVVIGKNTSVGAGSSIGAGVVIGENCDIGANVTIEYADIGNGVIIHPGVRVGQDGFGFAFHKGAHHKVPQLGRVIIEDDVEIGANTTIDRGAAPDTIIGKGTKIDNLVQIGHNVQIGKHCIIVAHVGISGSTKLDDYVVVGGQVGIAGHLHIGTGAQFAAQSGVVKDVKPGAVLCGSPAVPIKQFHRQTISLQKLAKKKN